MSRSSVVLLSVVVLLAGCVSAPPTPGQPALARLQPAGQGDFTFIAMGDSQPVWSTNRDVALQNPVFFEHIERINNTDADFIVSAGDLIMGYTEDADLLEREWDEFDDARRLFRRPLVFVIGNHDASNEMAEQVWMRRHGARYFSFDHKGCHFIALDTDLGGEIEHITGAQIEWLKQDLERARDARCIFVILHKPLWVRDEFGEEIAAAWDRDVHPLLARYGVDTVFAGHIHGYCLFPARDGVRYVITAGGGGAIGDYRLDGDFHHFLVVSVQGTTSQWRVITTSGEVPVDYVTDEKVRHLRDSFVVEPFDALSPDSDVAIRMRVKNPLDQPVQAVSRWELKGSTWTGESIRVDVPAGGTAALVARARAGSPVYPFPGGMAELVDGETKLFGWPFMSEALASIGPFVTNWNVVGPFGLGPAAIPPEAKSKDEPFWALDLSGWRLPLGPESGVDLNASYAGKDGQAVSWRPLSGDEHGLVDIDSAYTDDYGVACASAYIYSPNDATQAVLVGSDDAIAVRVNGEELFRTNALRGAAPDQDGFMAAFRPGWNEVVVKVLDRWGGWAFFFRVIDPERELRFARVPEE